MEKKENQFKKQIKCPRCGHLTSFESANPFRPFCSKRCKLIDLGAWADESYKIPLEDSSSITLDDAVDEDLGEPLDDNS